MSGGPLRTRKVALGLMAVGALAVTAGAFVLVSRLAPANVVQAEPPGTPRAGWYRAQLEADARAPRFDGEVNGIRISPSAVPTGFGQPRCGPGESTSHGGPPPAGTAIDVNPRHLPEGAALTSEVFTECRNTVTLVVKEYDVPQGTSSSQFGGFVQVRRVLDQRWVIAGVPDRARPTTVAGRPAVVVSPPTAEGVGPSLLAIREEWGITTLQADGLSEAELLRVAVGLYQEGGAR